MVPKVPVDQRALTSARAALLKQASELVTQECEQYVEATKLVIQATRLSIESRQMYVEALDLGRQIRHQQSPPDEHVSVETLEKRRQALCRNADDLHATAVQILTEAMRLRARLTMPRK